MKSLRGSCKGRATQVVATPGPCIPTASSRPRRGAAFARVELLAVSAGLVGLALVVLPALAGTRSRSDRVICANNLRQIGAAMQLWGNDHGERPPYYTFPADGGTRAHPLAPNVWLHFSWISNELASPRILLCPSDTGRPATDFSGSPDGGYLHPNFANRATSYLLSHDSGLHFYPTTFMSGDRNVGGTRDGGFSSLFGSSSLRIDEPYSPAARWTEGLHSPGGNALRNDGQVVQLSSGALRATFTPSVPSLFQFTVPR
jgi:hypothetical protein